MKKLLTFVAILGTLATHAQSTCEIEWDHVQKPGVSERYKVLFKNLTNYSLAPSTWVQYSIDFGDGSNFESFEPYTYHNYATPGNYLVVLFMLAGDSVNNQRVIKCTDSIGIVINVYEPTSPLKGHILWDSTNYNPVPPDSFIVWLIKYDSSQNTLTAIDSVTAVGPIGGPIGDVPFSFYPLFHGNYLLKAALKYPVAGTTGPLPTYHDSSLYWNTAATFFHDSNSTEERNIWVQLGTVTSGPGFVGGNISAGAGRGTGTGIAGISVFLRDENDKVIQYIQTDEEGNYSFEDLDFGSYNLYPEAINYTTVPSSLITIAEGQPRFEHINFEQKTDKIEPTGATSIMELTGPAALKVYPNPVHEKLFIDNEKGNFVSCSIINFIGQEVVRQTITKGINEISLHHLPSGMYSLTVKGTNPLQTIKIIKR